MTKANYISSFLLAVGILMSGVLPAMSQELETNPEEEQNKLSFDVDQSETIQNQNFISYAQKKDNSEATEPKDEIVSLRFVWNIPVNMATFTRNGKIWVVFDHQNKFDIDILKSEAKHMAKKIYSLPHPGGSILVIEPLSGVKHSIRQEGLLWILDLYTGKAPDFKIDNYTVFTQFDSLKNSYLFIPTPVSGNILSFIDPEIGDIITVSTTAKLGQGIEQGYRYPDFDVLQSSQGLAFVLNSSDIVMNRGNSGITIKAIGRGLNITHNLNKLKKMRQRTTSIETTSSNIFDLQISKEHSEMSLADVTEEYKKQIISAPPSQKNALRLKLAQYYVHHGLGTDALFILNQMRKLDIPESKSEHFYALSGIANFIARRYKQAIEDFSYGEIPNTDEGVFWRTIAKSANEYSEENNAVIFAHVSVMRDYPQAIKDEISIIAAKNAIATGDDLTSQNFIDILTSVPERIKNLEPQITYLNAQKLEMQGYMRNAVKQYKNLLDSDSAMFSAYARLRYISLAEILNFITLENAISELEKLRFSWGERSFKVKVLNQLAKLYLKNNDYYNTLRILNDEGFLVDGEEKQAVAKKMIKIFEDVFISNHADSILSPIKALALYQDFKWLAPLSDKHYHIIQKLADRLVAVDLLPRAQELLLSLLYKPDISHEAQAKIGARLAIIYLFEEKPSFALEAIEATNFDDIPDVLKSQRNIIASRALSDLGRTDDALALIETDTSNNALLRKFEIYWHAQDWDKASNTIKQLIEEPTPGKELSTQQINYILDWATTLKRAGKETVLVRLRNKFEPYFKDTAHQSAFNVLTNHLEEDKIDIGAIKTVISDIKNFNNFARFYTQSLEHEPAKEETETQSENGE